MPLSSRLALVLASMMGVGLGLGACSGVQPGPGLSEPRASAPVAHRDDAELATTEVAEPTGTPTEAGPVPPYDRKAWPHWIDADGDCQDTRNEVLIAESFESVRFEDGRRCRVEDGRWQCPFTGDIVDEVYLLDVDHLVPLANAHRSGAHAWTRERRQRYANDLEYPKHLVAVRYQTNRSKGDRGPEDWLPPLPGARCGYVEAWGEVKRRWELSMTEVEAQAVAEVQAICAAGGVPPLPNTSETDADASTCCRTCRKGKPCGDGCIAAAATCSKPAGCACAG